MNCFIKNKILHSSGLVLLAMFALNTGQCADLKVNRMVAFFTDGDFFYDTYFMSQFDGDSIQLLFPESYGCKVEARLQKNGALEKLEENLSVEWIEPFMENAPDVKKNLRESVLGFVVFETKYNRQPSIAFIGKSGKIIAYFGSFNGIENDMIPPDSEHRTFIALEKTGVFIQAYDFCDQNYFFAILNLFPNRKYNLYLLNNDKLVLETDVSDLEFLDISPYIINEGRYTARLYSKKSGILVDEHSFYFKN